MNPAGDQSLKRLIYRAMADYLGFPAKLRADNSEREMSAAGVALVACMPGAVVLNIDQHRFQGSQSLADFVSDAHQAGKVLRKGLTVTLA
jgi:hypothetical protein